MADSFHDFFEQEHMLDGEDHKDVSSPHMPPAPPSSRKAMRKARGARKAQRTVKTILAVVLAIALCVGLFFGVRAVRNWAIARRNASQESLVQDYPGPGGEEVSFKVPTGSNWASVAEELHKQDIIKSAAALTSIAGTSTLYPGTFTLRTQMKASDVLAILSDNAKAEGFLEVRAGERLSDVLAQASQLTSFSIDELNQALVAILPAEAQGNGEGWLEPGTYDVAQADSAELVVKPMLEARIKKLDEFGVPSGQERENIIIIASIAEAEVNSQEYYAKVTRVIENRLAQGMPLGMDTTVAYGLGIKASELTNAQLADDTNPYNTRLHQGLPPSAISNPGDNAIKAALEPEEGSWLYFVTVNLKTGETKFATTEDEFWKIRDEYKANNPDAN